MKILTKEEEQQHYYATVKGGTGGGLAGLAAGALGVWAASQRYPAFRSLSLPFRAFLVTSTGTFAAIVAADRSSRTFETARRPGSDYKDTASNVLSELEKQKPVLERARDWAKENRYSIVFASWVASMGIALGLVGRNPYLTGSQKLVQARVYAQGLTLAVLVASFAIETNDASQGKGRWETVKIIDPNDPTHKHIIEKKIHHERYAGEDQWRDMVEAEERKMKEREQHAAELQEKEKKPRKEQKEHEEHKEHKEQKRHS